MKKLQSGFEHSGYRWNVEERFDYWVFLSGKSLGNVNGSYPPVWTCCQVIVENDCEYVKPFINGQNARDRETMYQIYLKGIKNIESQRSTKETEARIRAEKEASERRWFDRVGELHTMKYALIGELKDIQRSTKKTSDLVKIKRVKEISEELNIIETLKSGK